MAIVGRAHTRARNSGKTRRDASAKNEGTEDHLANKWPGILKSSPSQVDHIADRANVTLPCPGQIHTYFLKKSLCFAADFKLFATGFEICFTAKLTNLNNGNAPTTIMKSKVLRKYTSCTVP